MALLDYFHDKIDWKSFSTRLIPSACILCRDAVTHSPCLCVKCWREMIFIEEPYCKITGLPFVYDMGDGIYSSEATSFTRYFEASRAPFLYNYTCKKFIHAFKYYDKSELAAFAVPFMLKAGQDLITQSDLILPIPLHYYRYIWRRYNQSAELARRLSVLAKKPYEPNLLKRVRVTQKQVGLSQSERMRNLNDVFKISDSAKIRGKIICLVDDVITTGSTMNEATKVLLEAGAKKVYALAIAKVALEKENYALT